MTSNRKTLSGGALLILIVLFIGLMLVVNVMFRGARVDLTQNNLYTLSSGTKEILAKLDEPINLYLFYSDKGSQNIPQLRTYATRVRELLEEMAARSNGNIHLQVIDRCRSRRTRIAPRPTVCRRFRSRPVARPCSSAWPVPIRPMASR